MTVTSIYNATPSSNAINNTAYCNGATALYMTNASTWESEIDFYLQLEVSPTTNRLIKLNDMFILDTVIIYTIPIELQSLPYNVYGAFTTALGSYIEIWAIFPNVSLQSLDDKLTELLEQGAGDGVPQETLDFIVDSLTTLLALPIGGGGGLLGGGSALDPLPLLGF